MAVAGMASADDHAVRPSFKGPQDKHGIHPAGTGYPDDLHVRGVREAAAACQIRAGVAAPVAAESHDLRPEFFFCFYRHIASTSARICLFENPCRSIAPDGHVTVQAPQPWQIASLTTATLLVSRTPLSITSLSS